MQNGSPTKWLDLLRDLQHFGHHLRPGQARRGYTGQIDSFGVYCPETRGVYLIPPAHVPTRNNAALRVERSLNGQRKRIGSQAITK